MQIIVHDVMGDRLIALNDMFVYWDDVHVFGDVIADYVLICELIDQINVDFGVALTTGIRILTSRQQSLKNTKITNTKKNIVGETLAGITMWTSSPNFSLIT